jgi:hypothetical protein
MKKITMCILIALLASCSDPKPETTSSENKTALSKQVSQVAGNWISDQYLENIKKTKSVYQNKMYGTKVLFFNLDKNELETGSATLHGFTDHEGGYDVPIKFNKEKNEFVKDDSKKSDDPTFKDFFELKPNQTKLEIYFPQTKTIETYQNLSTDLDTELRKILFTGNYTDADSKSKINFSDNGEVNFRDYKSYRVINDFTTGPDFDAIIFYKSIENGDLYQFKIVDKTLELQFMQGNNNDPTYKANGKKIILIKE